MKRESRTIDRSDQVDSFTQRHLPLVDLLVDTRAELMELAVASGLKVEVSKVDKKGGSPAREDCRRKALADYIRELGGVDGKVYADRLHQIAIGKHKDTRSRLTAIGTLLERVFGKPPQAIEHSGSIGSMPELETMSDEERRLSACPWRSTRPSSWNTSAA